MPSTGLTFDPVLQRRYVAFKDPDGIAWEFYMAPNVPIEVVERYLDALRTGNESGVGALLAPTHTVAVRLDALDGTPGISTAKTRADAQKFLISVFAGARDIAIVSRIATDWYVFAEYVADLGGGRVRRFAATHPIEDGAFTGTFGYGKEERISA